MRITLTLAAALALAAGGAFAQSISPNQSSQDAADRGQGIVTPRTGGSVRAPDLNPAGTPRTNLPDWTAQNGNRADEARQPPVARTGQPAPVVAVVPPAPVLSDHQRACAARYRTYDPATDMFFARPGVKQRCRIVTVAPRAVY